MCPPETPVRRQDNTLVIDTEAATRPGIRPPSPADVRHWLDDEEVEVIDLGQKRGLIQPTTWHG